MKPDMRIDTIIYVFTMSPIRFITIARGIPRYYNVYYNATIREHVTTRVKPFYATAAAKS